MAKIVYPCSYFETFGNRMTRNIIRKPNDSEIECTYGPIKEGVLTMSKTQELLEATRVTLGGVSDYRLGKTLGIPGPTMSEYVRGIRHADAYAAVRIAIALNRDPLEVIAEVEAETARTPTKRDFWSRFPSGLRRTALGVGLSAIFVTSALGPRTGEAASPESTSHNVYYVKSSYPQR